MLLYVFGVGVWCEWLYGCLRVCDEVCVRCGVWLVLCVDVVRGVVRWCDGEVCGTEVRGGGWLMVECYGWVMWMGVELAEGVLDGGVVRCEVVGGDGDMGEYRAWVWMHWCGVVCGWSGGCVLWR